MKRIKRFLLEISSMFYENELWLTSPRQESSSFSATGCVPKVESDCCLKANNEAKFVERKVCFILEASNQWGRVDFCPMVNSPWLATSGQELLQMERGGLFTEIVQSALTVILKLVMQWSDQCHLDCLKYSSSLIPGSIFSNFFEASLLNCGSLMSWLQSGWFSCS